MTTINLNGHTINSGNEAFARVREQGRITMTGAGNVNGRLSGGFNASSFIVSGGTYTADVTGYVANGYSAYNMNGAYLVEPIITADNFVVSPVNLEEITIRKGQTAQINVTLPAGSTPGVTFSTNENGVIEIDANGRITAVGTGYTYVTVSPNYNPAIEKGLFVNVYTVEPTVDETDDQYEGEAGAAENVIGLIDEGLYDDNGDVTDKVKKAFGEDDAEDAADYLSESMYYGEVINTAVYVDEANLTDSERVEMAALMDGVNMDNIRYYDVTVEVYGESGFIGSLHEMDNPIRVFIAEVTDPAAGYTRKYYMVSYHNGEPELLEEGVDFEIVDGKIYLISNKFSVFALGYKDTLKVVAAAAPDTGTVTAAGASATNAASVTAMAAGILVSIVGVAYLIRRKS